MIDIDLTILVQHVSQSSDGSKQEAPTEYVRRI